MSSLESQAAENAFLVRSMRLRGQCICHIRCSGCRASEMDEMLEVNRVNIITRTGLHVRSFNLKYLGNHEADADTLLSENNADLRQRTTKTQYAALVTHLEELKLRYIHETCFLSLTLVTNFYNNMPPTSLFACQSCEIMKCNCCLVTYPSRIEQLTPMQQFPLGRFSLAKQAWPRIASNQYP